MMRVLLDTMIYDKLATDQATRQTAAEKISSGAMTVVASPIVVGELNDSPFKGIPNFFPVCIIAEAVVVPGYAVPGLARPGDGKILDAHIGMSKKAKDAIIADTAASDCDVFVSDDIRCRKRLQEIGTRCRVLDYSAFKEWLKTI